MAEIHRMAFAIEDVPLCGSLNKSASRLSWPSIRRTYRRLPLTLAIFTPTLHKVRS